MSDSKVLINPQGAYVDTNEVETPAGKVHRQRVEVTSLPGDQQVNFGGAAQPVTVENTGFDANITNPSIDVNVLNAELADISAKLDALTNGVRIARPNGMEDSYSDPEDNINVTVTNMFQNMGVPVMPHGNASEYDAENNRTKAIVRDFDVEASVDALHKTMARELPRLIAEALDAAPQYARDENDRLRVVLSGGSVTTVEAVRYGNAGSALTPMYGVGSPMAYDARDMLRELSLQNFLAERQRWTF